MKKLVLIPTILGSVLLIAGGAIFAVGLSSCSKKEALTHESAIEQEFNNIEFDVDVSEIKFYPTSDGTRKVVFKESEKMYHTFNVAEGNLKIEFKDERKWYDKMFNTTHYEVDLYIPGAHYGELKVKNDTGSITIPSDFSFDNVNIKVSTGNINLNTNVTESLNVEASTGNISLNSLEVKNATLKASTGNIDLRDIVVMEKLNLKTSTGNKTLTNVTAWNFNSESSTGKTNLVKTVVAEHMEINASTGDVKFDESDANTIKVKTSTGDVKGTLLTSKVFYAKSDTGRIDVPKSTTGGMCEIETDTGDIVISIKG